MGYGLVYDGPPTRCAKGPRPGTKALEKGVMERFGCGTQGIFNCRPIRTKGSTVLSFHADGRAWDAKCSGELNRRIADWLVANADELGVQEVICTGRRRWTSRTRTWAHYGGDDDHSTHVHVAQCIRAANSLTLATVRAIGGEGPTPPDQEDDDMPKLYRVDSGPDKGKIFWVGNGDRVYVDDPAKLPELERQYGKVTPINEVAWWYEVQSTALNEEGARSIPPKQVDALVKRIADALKA